jgi:mannose-6-phosphate isomerase-like protein (cupin superfamily)
MCGALAEVHARADVWDDLAMDRPLATDEMGDFGAHAYKRSSGLAWGLCNSLHGKRYLLHRRIATVPFTLRNLNDDLEELGPRFDGAPDLEFRLATEALELEQSGLSYQRVPPGYRFPYGHTHKKQEEVYVVVRGSGRMKLDAEIVELKEWDAVRVPPGTWRGYEAGAEGLEIIVIGAPNLGEAPREDVEGQRDWWAD